VLAALIRFAADRGKPRRSRLAVVGALGSFVKKEAAASLLGLMNDDSEETQIRDAVPEPLIRMTGLQQFGDDTRQWSAWWKSVANQPDREWELTQFRNRSARMAQIDRERQRVAVHVKDVLDREYQRAPKEQRPDMLLGWLRDAEPVIRAVAADKVNDEKINGNVISPALLEQLRDLIGDSNVEVRKAAVVAVGAINDAASVDPLLAQLAVESDTDVKIAIARGLGILKRTKSIDALLALMNGPPTRAADAVAEAAAESLTVLGEAIREDAAIKAKVSVNLRVKLETTSARAGTESLQAAILEALAQLHDRSLLHVFIASLEAIDPHTLMIRIAACRGLGNMAEDPNDKDQAAAALVNALRHDSAGRVQLEAARALGKVGTIDRADALFEQMSPRSAAADESVRDACWAALSTILQREATYKDLLGTWKERFKFEPAPGQDPKKRAIAIARRLVILQAARDKLIAEAPKNPEADRMLAEEQQDIGEAQMALDQWDKAAASFRASMAYWQAHKGRRDIIEQLSVQLIDALLRAGNYSEAAQFAGERITADPQEARDLGQRFQSEVEELMKAKKPEDLKNALQLIEESQKIRPPLGDTYVETLQLDRERIKRRLASLGTQEK
jgi:HEAT repeat protein